MMMDCLFFSFIKKVQNLQSLQDNGATWVQFAKISNKSLEFEKWLYWNRYFQMFHGGVGRYSKTPYLDNKTLFSFLDSHTPCPPGSWTLHSPPPFWKSWRWAWLYIMLRIRGSRLTMRGSTRVPLELPVLRSLSTNNFVSWRVARQARTQISQPRGPV